MKGLLRFKISVPFLFKNVKKFLSVIKACFKISPYPQINSLFGSELKKLISEITRLGW